MNFCHNCGNKISDQDGCCFICGTRLAQNKSAASEEAAAVENSLLVRDVSPSEPENPIEAPDSAVPLGEALSTAKRNLAAAGTTGQTLAKRVASHSMVQRDLAIAQNLLRGDSFDAAKQAARSIDNSWVLFGSVTLLSSMLLFIKLAGSVASSIPQAYRSQLIKENLLPSGVEIAIYGIISMAIILAVFVGGLFLLSQLLGKSPNISSVANLVTAAFLPIAAANLGVLLLLILGTSMKLTLYVIVVLVSIGWAASMTLIGVGMSQLGQRTKPSLWLSVGCITLLLVISLRLTAGFILTLDGLEQLAQMPQWISGLSGFFGQ